MTGLRQGFPKRLFSPIRFYVKARRTPALIEQVFQSRVTRLVGVSPALAYGCKRRCIGQAPEADQPSRQYLAGAANTCRAMNYDSFSASVRSGEEGQNDLCQRGGIGKLKILDRRLAQIVLAEALRVCLQQVIVANELLLGEQADDALYLLRLHKRYPGVHRGCRNNRKWEAGTPRAKDRGFVGCGGGEAMRGVTDPLR
jgi:hypothetical protein